MTPVQEKNKKTKRFHFPFPLSISTPEKAEHETPETNSNWVWWKITVIQTGPFQSTHQLKLPATIVGVLYARVGPQSGDGRQVLLEDGRLQLPGGHLSRPGVKRHQAVPVPLVVLVTPRDVQLFPGIHQHTHTWRGSEKVGVWERGPSVERYSLLGQTWMKLEVEERLDERFVLFYQKDYTKTTEQISTKPGRTAGLCPEKRPETFWGWSRNFFSLPLNIARFCDFHQLLREWWEKNHPEYFSSWSLWCRLCWLLGLGGGMHSTILVCLSDGAGWKNKQTNHFPVFQVFL